VGTKSEIKDLVIQACQCDKRTNEYIGPFSRFMYRIIPDHWYRRIKSFLIRNHMQRIVAIPLMIVAFLLLISCGIFQKEIIIPGSRLQEIVDKNFPMISISFLPG